MILALALALSVLHATPCARELVIDEPYTERLPRLSLRPGARISSAKQILLNDTLSELKRWLGPLAVGNLQILDWGVGHSGTNVETGQITLNLRLARKAIRVQLKHEYAHIVFNDHLRIILQDRHASLREHQLRRYRGELSRAAERELGEYVARLRPYAELFADFVVVITEGDPGAVAETLSEPKTRHFKALNPVRGWPRDRRLYIAWYTLLDPARVTLWRKFARNITEPNEMSRFLLAFLAASEAQLGAEGQSPEQLNREFFRLVASGF